MTLYVHRAERADRLVTALGDLLSTPLPDPFATEIISVPTRGVERWLSQGLAQRLGTSPGRNDGVCVGVAFPSPRRLVARALAGSAAEEDIDPWQPQRAVWPLLRVIDGCRGEQWAALLWHYLGGGRSAELDPLRAGRRWSTARHLAGLFTTYAAIRPAMINSWSQGRDIDASGAPLPPDRAWQAELWRRLRDELATPSPTERLQAAVARLRLEPESSDLPQRLSVFGATRVEPDHLLVLSVLAEHRDVHLWLAHPSPALWDRVKAAVQRTGLDPSQGSRRCDDTTEEFVRHRLLAYLGRDIRELQLVLAKISPSAADVHHEAPESTEPETLLDWLQSDIAANRQPRPRNEKPLLTPDDQSIQVHACHGPDRQVEVPREVLVGLLADDDTLEPRDIVVMCPDIERFAPLIAASFGLDTPETQAEHPGHRLRVRLADRSLRQLNPLLALVSRVVALADSRVGASALLDLCAAPPVARKFSFSQDDLERLRDLVPRAGVRWGFDAEHRRRFQMGEFRQNTWAAGLERLLLGVTMDETDQHFIGTTLPLDDVDAADVDLVGRLAEMVARVNMLIAACNATQPLNAWVELFKQAIEMLASVPPGDVWQLSHAYHELGDLALGIGQAGDVPLSLPEVSALLSEAFRGRASRANFRTGTLTVCTMLPMRSVPHRVVCLLGVDDGVFPRRPAPDGDNLASDEECIGDHDVRSEDRQLLLDAIMSARERLVIIFSGTDPRSGAEIPPAVPIGELLDALDATARTSDGEAVRTKITTRHPLQPFDAANFTPGRLTTLGLFSFDRASLRAVRAASGERRAPALVFSSQPLPERDDDGLVSLSDLIRFFNHPIRTLLSERAGLWISQPDETPDEQIPVSLTGLESWSIGDRLLRLRMAGHQPELLTAAEWRRGYLPPRGLGQRAIDEITKQVEQLMETAQPFLTVRPAQYEVLAGLSNVRLTGTVSSVIGESVVHVSYSKLAAKHRLMAWLELLALTVTDPSRAWQAVTVGRGGCSQLGPVDAQWAATVLADLIDLRATGLREAIPFSPKASAEYAALRFRDRQPALYRRQLDKLWAQDRDEAYERFFGEGAGFDAMLAQPSIPAEERGSMAEPSRFGTLARRVFQPLLSVEDLR
ncbi:MAG TPA: exodeoxyribonuclease V subunit gamma [Propionibacteriaceae bacterium]|nr:exodeoxyribonuclease V subunit gamma [Propionibacteriaceae bacterium]